MKTATRIGTFESTDCAERVLTLETAIAKALDHLDDYCRHRTGPVDEHLRIARRALRQAMGDVS